MFAGGIFLIAALSRSHFYLPSFAAERMAHKSQKFQFESGRACLFSSSAQPLFGVGCSLPWSPADFSTPRAGFRSVEKMAGVRLNRIQPSRRLGMRRTLLHPPRPRPASRRPVAPRARCTAMLELLLCSLLTILPDYLYRRYRQGKRLGHEITLYSVWFELRFGIISCLMLTVALITMIFYYHPSTTSATLYFRSVPIVPKCRPGRGSSTSIQRIRQKVTCFQNRPRQAGSAILTANKMPDRCAMLAAQAYI